MIDKNLIDAMYAYVEGAVSLCNLNAKRIKAETFDPAKTTENFVDDLMMLAFYPVNADKMLSKNEVKKLNEALDIYDYEISVNDMYEACRIAKTVPFEVPKTFKILVLKAWTVLQDNSFPALKDLWKYNEISTLKINILMYARFMCSIVDAGGIKPEEKAVMRDCLKKCCDYVYERLGEKLNMEDEYNNIIDNWESWGKNNMLAGSGPCEQ